MERGLLHFVVQLIWTMVLPVFGLSKREGSGNQGLQLVPNSGCGQWLGWKGLLVEVMELFHAIMHVTFTVNAPVVIMDIWQVSTAGGDMKACSYATH